MVEGKVELMTCGILFKINDKIWIGADDLAAGSGVIKHFCKILKRPPYTMAFAGNAGFLFAFKYFLNDQMCNETFDNLCNELPLIFTLSPKEDCQMIITDGVNMAAIDWIKSKWTVTQFKPNNGDYIIIGTDEGRDAAKKYIDNNAIGLGAETLIKGALQAAHEASPKTIGKDFTIIPC